VGGAVAGVSLLRMESRQDPFIFRLGGRLWWRWGGSMLIRKDTAMHSRSIHRNVLSGRIERKVLQICGDLDSIYDQLSLIGIASTLQWLQVQPCSCIDKP
jgi:hypothetical protein